MAGFARNPDDIAQTRRAQEHIRRLLTRRPEDQEITTHTYAHAFIVGGEIAIGMFIPPWRNLHPDPNLTGDPTTTVADFSDYARLGAVSFNMQASDDNGATWSIIAAGAGLAYGTLLRPVITASDAVDISIGFTVTPISPVPV